ncbi:uncharacterized protein LOC129287829 isoform X2 [Prosopis cineraria]|uniref:uncharacterized protein LOC129287829 isoform X2 n=1 Tax=Prosopis cineraria TaxID=364024 RepID=UPI002410608F|nr:uncharacterized protein LOC129287829 isoform X2 [Prosopis cineraria]
MGSSVSREQSRIDTKLYKWSSEEFHEECALMYTSTGRLLAPRSRTSYYRVNPNKLILTFDNHLILSNRVRVNMEFKAVRDSNGLYKFGAVKLKDSGDVLSERSLGTSESKVLLQMTILCLP